MQNTFELFHIDAFTSKPFSGNPAAVVPLASWLPPTLMQQIAAENNLSETAFFVPVPAQERTFHLRWFTPTTEVDLCGHATLAAAYVVLRLLHPDWTRVTFTTQSAGDLAVEKTNHQLAMNFPSRPSTRLADPNLLRAIAAALGATPAELHQARDLMAVFDSQETVQSLKPDMQKIAALPTFGLIATAPGNSADFVSRFFAPAQGVPEDPVTGSAHCTLIPFWSHRLAKTQLLAQQLSPRGGTLYCTHLDSRVQIAGHATLYMEGKISL